MAKEQKIIKVKMPVGIEPDKIYTIAVYEDKQVLLDGHYCRLFRAQGSKLAKVAEYASIRDAKAKFSALIYECDHVGIRPLEVIRSTGVVLNDEHPYAIYEEE